MATYFFARNEGGDLVIDDDYQNLHLAASGTATVASTPQGLGYLTTVATAAVTSEAVIAISGATPAVVIGKALGASFMVFSAGPPGSSFNWWIFDKFDAMASGNAGLQIWDAAGKVVFDSNRKPMRVLGQSNISAAFGIGSDGGVWPVASGLPSGRTLAWALMNVPVSVYSQAVAGQGSEPNYVYTVCPRQVVDGAVGGIIKRFAVFGGAQNYTHQRSGRALILDVTGF